MSSATVVRRSNLLHTPSYFRSILRRFPDVEFAFAYGSGVYGQRSYDLNSTGRKPTIDVVMAVRDARAWHARNLLEHPEHYAQPLRTMGASSVAKVQRMGAGVYYHPIVTIEEGQELKYGVVEVDVLSRDLKEWNTLFCAGRLQKPTFVMKETQELEVARKQNYASAVAVSVLLLPETFSALDLFLTVTGLSYSGDPRFDFGAENRDKVSNIVEANMSGFVDLYENVVADCPWIDGPSLRADDPRSPNLVRSATLIDATDRFLEDVPLALRATVGDANRMRRLIESSDITEVIRGALASVVRRHAPAQYAKGILSAGLSKSVTYVRSKLSKGVLSHGRKKN